MTIIARVVGDSDGEAEIEVVEVNAPFVITKVKDKLYIAKDGKYILTKVLSLEIFESGICIKKIDWCNKAIGKEQLKLN